MTYDQIIINNNNNNNKFYAQLKNMQNEGIMEIIFGNCVVKESICWTWQV